jgi:hypothetical protein
MRKIIGLTAFAGLVTCCSARAGDSLFEAFFGQYFQRVDAVTIGAGDAKQVNSTAEIIDPWPRYVQNRRISANGQRMSGAVNRYQDVRKLRGAPQPIDPVYSLTTNVAPTTVSSGGGGGGGGPAQ